ncbi:MAG: septum formation protein Maf [Nitrospinae bacterium]|nr:septum formation protein Maf [Nitrospinota bacterium]
MKSITSFILASSSPRRKEILESIGLEFTIIPSDFDESTLNISEPEEFCRIAATEKAKAVAKTVHEGFFPKWILASDTIVYSEKRHKIYGKPQSKENALEILRELCGEEHQVMTSVCLLNRLNPLEHEVIVVKTGVLFNDYPDEILKNYINTGEPMDKAGSYGIQGKGLFLVKEIHGSFTNVIGLPLNETLQLLSR